MQHVTRMEPTAKPTKEWRATPDGLYAYLQRTGAQKSVQRGRVAAYTLPSGGALRTDLLGDGRYLVRLFADLAQCGCT